MIGGVRMKIGYGVVSVIMTALLSGCASTGSVDVVRRDVDEAKTRIYTAEKELAATREGEKSFKADFAALRKSDADIQALIDGVKSDMQALSGKVDDFGISMKKPSEEFSRYREDSDRRIVALEDRIVKLQAALDELNKRMNNPNQAEGGDSSGVETKPDALYIKGLEMFKAGDMPGARTHLAAFVEKNPQHDLVPNARYWIGETYYSEKSYEKAALEFQEVIKLYPKKEKAPAALFKQALAFKAMKDINSSKYLLKKLTTEYPKSEEAKKAKVLIKEMR